MESGRLGLPVAPLEVLRQRRSAKWRTYPADVLPLTVAEMDFNLAAPVSEALRDAVDRSDSGYAMPVPDLGEALAGFAADRWNWDIDPFLAWLNCSAVGPDNEARERFLAHGRVALEPGLRFGAAGSGHARLNFATSAGILDQATAGMAKSV
jgi:bifunctional pyridoxal-dependent enzyme with beta-cystathionase and maltose regulon repressor activities